MGMADWVIIVDDDVKNLDLAGRVLSGIGIKVTALRSGQALLDYLRDNASSAPNLILMDIQMPGMDGFETLLALKQMQEGQTEIPVIFLSADQKQESETRGLQLGAMDFIRKPIIPEVLISRVQNALRTQERLQQLVRSSMIDHMTGFFNKETAESQMENICRTETGLLCVLDLDSFKLINDLYGHDMGDKVLILFSNLLKHNMRAEDVCGRIGGDEFILFAKNMLTQTELEHFTERINRDYLEMMKKLMGEHLKFPVGVSIGAASVPAHGQEYSRLFHLADQALNAVKLNGKHGCALSGSPHATISDSPDAMNLEAVTMILEERNISASAMWMGREAFINIYRYMMRYMERYHGVAYRVLFTINMVPEADDKVARADVVFQFRHLIQDSLRNSDVMVEISDRQIFLLLPETQDAGIEVVINRLMNKWNRSDSCSRATVTWEAAPVHLVEREAEKTEKREEDWIVVVDDAGSLNSAEYILSRKLMRVTMLESGPALLEFVKTNHPDLILLDADMPEMDGYETLRQLKQSRHGGRDIPVLMVTDSDAPDAEARAVQTGAEDVIRKPFHPDILTSRVRNTIDRVRCQQNLSYEVTAKTEQSQKLYLDVIGALTGAVDAKNTCTSGHSHRVARYAKEIARRYGYSEKKQADLYMMGLLHDVGKIDISDAIINKPAKLTEAEYEIIKTHSVTGARMLQSINEMPSLAVGARWHHERYDGGGYPDGLAGKSIPEEARIIAVADAYDAMTSVRSYREPLTREAVKDELRKGIGTQFDPTFARIMLRVMDDEERNNAAS